MLGMQSLLGMSPKETEASAHSLDLQRRSEALMPGGSGLCKHTHKRSKGGPDSSSRTQQQLSQPGNPAARLLVPSASGSPTPATTQAAAETLNSPVAK